MAGSFSSFFSSLKLRHAAAILFVAVFGAYLNSLDNGLVNFDDLATTAAREGAGPAPCLGEFPITWSNNPAMAVKVLALTRPLRDLSLCADRVLLGDSAWAHHLSNVAHHWAAATAAFLAARLLLGSAPLALLAALLFALHPLQTESVAYIGGRRDVLFGGLYLLAFFLSASALRRRSAPLAAAGGAAWLLALAAKQAAVTLPFAVALWYFLSLPKEERPPLPRRALLAGLAGGALAAAYAVFSLVQLTFFAKMDNAGAVFYGGSLLSQYLTMPLVLAKAVVKTLLPLSLHGDYSYLVIPPPASPAEGPFLAACALLAAAGWGAVKAARGSRPALFGLAFAALAFGPMLPLFPHPHNLEVFAEHWLYLPLFGFAVFAAERLGALRLSPRGAGVLAAALLLFYAGRTAARNPDWKDGLTFWGKTAAAAPGCGRALGALGAEYLNMGRNEEAEELFKRAAAIRPDSPTARLNYAAALERRGAYAEAEAQLKAALRLKGIRPSLQGVQYALARVYLLSGREKEAERHVKWAIEARPFQPRPQALDLLAWLKARRGETAQAEALLHQALDMHPGYFPAPYSLAQLREAQGDCASAARLLDRALALAPAHAPSLALAAACAAQSGAYTAAAGLVSKALYLAPSSPEALTAAARLYRQQGKFKAALPYALRAAAAGPRDAGANLEAALALMETGRLQEAEKKFLAVLALAPSDPQARLGYADLLWITGRHGAALAQVQAILRARPGHPPALDALRIMKEDLGAR